MRSFTIGRIFGIPIRLDLTFLLILPVFAWLIGAQVGQWVGILNGVWATGLDPGPLTDGSMEWLLGSAAAIGLFVAVVLHELGHSVVAMRFGFPIESITLWLFGGIASLSDQPEDWREELLIAVAGPVVSILLGVIAFLALFVIPEGQDAVRFVAGYLALMNFALAAFNLLPGFPMDGGRVLRALLTRTRPFARATKIAAEVGKAFAILLGLFGLLNLNLILIGIAFFIYIGASSEAQQTVLNAAFEGVTVRDVMTPVEDVKTVTTETTVEELLNRMFSERHTGYPVVEDDRPIGMVTLTDAREVPTVEQAAYTVGDVMSTDLKTVPAHGDAMTALESIQRHDIGRLLVVDADGEFAGLISRTDLMTAFDIIQRTGTERSPEPERTLGS